MFKIFIDLFLLSIQMCGDLSESSRVINTLTNVQSRLNNCEGRLAVLHNAYTLAHTVADYIHLPFKIASRVRRVIEGKVFVTFDECHT